MRKISFIPMNLQLFAEDGGASGGFAAPPDTGSSSEATTTTTATTSTESGETTGGETDTSSSVSDNASQKVAQTPEQNAFFREARLKADAAEKRAIAAEQARQRDISIAKKYGPEYGVYSEEDIAAKFGQTHGIKNLTDFEAALQRQEYQKNGIDPDMINQIINEHPDVKKAREFTARQEVEHGNQILNSELSDLNKEYPDLKLEGIGDLLKLDNSDKIYQLAKQGYSLLHAYEAVNRDVIRKQQSEATRQATLNNIQGKGHVRGNGSGSEIDTTRIPDEVLEMYKKFNPGKSLEEYKKHYKSSLK